MSFEFLERPALEGLDDIGIGRIGQDDIAPLMEHLGFLQVSDLDFAADILCSLSPFEFDAFDAELFNGVFLNAKTGIFDVGLDDNGAVAVALVILVKLDAALQVDRIDHAAVLDHGLGIHAHDVFADGQAGSGKRGSDGQPFPVVLGDVGRADSGDDPGITEFDAFVVADGHFKIDGREDRLVAVGLDAVRADSGPHDVEMRIIDGVDFLRGGRDDAKGLRIDHLMAAVGGLADFAHADAAIHAGDAHAGGRNHGALGSVLRESCC